MLKPRMLYGLNTAIKNNIFYVSDEEILYPVCGVITIHNFKQNTQRYINLPNAENEISVITASLKKKCVAIAEKGGKGEKPKIYIYDIETLTKKKTLGIPFEVNTEEFICLSFSHDSNYIAALTGSPDYVMYYYNWQNAKIESQTKANNPPSTPGPVTDMAINPRDSTIVVFVGIGLFRLVSMSENVWRQYGFQKAQNFSILSVCWLTDDRVLAGCKDGKVIIVQSGDLNVVYDINETTQMNIIPVSESKKLQMKTLSRTYKKSTTFVIKKDVSCDDVDYNSLYAIQFICTSLDDSKLFCTTNRSQIYWTELRGHNFDSVEFEIFGQPLHHGSVTGLSTCLWKPIFMTCGADNSVRIWNYMNMKLLLNQTFRETIKCVSLHPTGLYALIGFSDKVRFLLVLIEELQTYREFGIRQCQALSFSNNGHIFAAECNYDILVYSSITFNKISCFKGHYKQITSLQWSYNDFVLYSSSINGAVYEWSIEKSTRLSDVVMREVEIKGLTALNDGKIMCVTRDGGIKEIQDAKVIRTLKLNHENASHLDVITKLHSDDLLLAAKNGLLIWLKYPIDEEPEFSCFLMHNKTISQFCLVNNNQSFVSCDIDGNICVWEVSVRTGEINVLENHFEEILINTNDLDKKNQTLKHLTCRITEIESEHSFEMKQSEKEYTNKIEELEEYYNLADKNWKKKIKSLEKEHSMELNRLHLDITQMRQTHTLQMDQLDSNFNGKLLYEFQKYDTLKEDYEKLKKSYDIELDEIKRTMSAENETQLFRLQSEISDLQRKLLLLENTLKSEKEQKEKTIKQYKTKLDEEMKNFESSYEFKLRGEATNNFNLKTEIGILNKKLTVMEKEKEEFKTNKAAFETEYKNLKQKYTELSNRNENRKRILTEKEKLVEQERKNVTELRGKVKEIMNVKSDLENKIDAIGKQLQQNENRLISKTEKLREFEKKVKTEEKQNAKLQTEIIQFNNKLQGNESIMRVNRIKIHELKTEILNMKREITALKDFAQYPEKLKQQIKVLVQKYEI